MPYWTENDNLLRSGQVFSTTNGEVVMLFIEDPSNNDHVWQVDKWIDNLGWHYMNHVTNTTYTVHTDDLVDKLPGDYRGEIRQPTAASTLVRVPTPTWTEPTFTGLIR